VSGPGIAVVGYGYWGPNFARNFADLESCNLVAIAESDPGKRALAARRHPGARTCEGIDEVLGNSAVEAVVLATPVATHFDLATAALDAGKHVLVSKPLTHSVETSEALVERADMVDRILMVDHTFVYTGAVRKMAELAASGELGKIYCFDSMRMNLGLLQPDVGVLWDLAPHDLSIVRHVLGVLPSSVIAVGGRHIGPMTEVAYLILRYADGMLGHVQASWLAPAKVRTTILVGSKKMVIYDDNEVVEKVKVFDSGVEVHGDPEGLRRARVEYRAGDVWAPRLEATEALRSECDHFVECIGGRAVPLTDGRSGLEVVRVLAAAERSMAEGSREIEV
jgi:predicted dehydrogenase